MFDKLKRTLSDAVKSISEKELNEKDIDKVFFDMQVALLESDVASEVIDHLAETMKKDLVGKKLEKGQNAQKIVVNPDLKIFVGDSLAGNDTINQAREFHQYTKFDCAILTKTDADVKGGAAISIVHITGKPILYLGMGQQYDDLTPFNAQSFVNSILGDSIA